VLVMLALSQIFSVIMVGLAIRLIVGKNWPRRLALRRPSWSHLLLALIGLPGLMVLTRGVDGLAHQVLPEVIHLDETTKLFGEWPWYLGVLVVGLGPGITEELWFRGFIGRGLVGRYGVVRGVLLTSLFFGLVHVEPRQAAYAAFMGIFLHLAYLASRSLWVPMLLHAANNSLSILTMHTSDLQAIDVEAEQIPWTVYGAAVLLVAAVAWAFYRSRTQLVPRLDGDRPAWRPAFPGVEYPPSGTATQVQRRTPNALSWLLTAAGVALFAGVVWAGLAVPDTKGQERKAATTPSARLGIIWEKGVRFGPPMWINYRGLRGPSLAAWPRKNRCRPFAW
jgi:membrane protease YdiL (CAAX protease family)